MARGRKLPVFLSEEEAARLVAAARTPRDRTMLQAMLLLGVRVAELVALRIERVDLARGQLLIFQGKGSRDRYLPISSRLEPVLREWIGSRTTGFLFPSPARPDQPISTRAVRYMVTAAARRHHSPRPDPARFTPQVAPHLLYLAHCQGR